MNAILRPATERGHANHGWLDSWHSFSFAHYYDPRHMGFRSLRVINDDVIAPGTGFATHGHQDMEIVTYVLRGQLAHKDSTGGAGVLARGDIQVMSAGTGIRHSEYNASDAEDLRLLQIWIVPPRGGLAPAYDQRTVPDEAKRDKLVLIAGPAALDPVLPIHQDARTYACLLSPGHTISHALAAGRGAWIQVADGAISVNGTALKTGDGLAVEDVDTITVTADRDAEFLLFDLA